MEMEMQMMAIDEMLRETRGREIATRGQLLSLDKYAQDLRDENKIDDVLFKDYLHNVNVFDKVDFVYWKEWAKRLHTEAQKENK